MKKILFVLLLLAPISALAASQVPPIPAEPVSEKSQAVQAQNQNQNENQNRVQTSNPQNTAAGSAVQKGNSSPTTTATSTEKNYGQQVSAEHRSAVANAVQALIQSSYQIENKGLGDQIRLIAQSQNENNEKMGESFDRSENRSSLAKFFIGPNYKELKDAKQLIARNRLEISNMEQVALQLQDDAEYANIKNQIETLSQQNTELENQLRSKTAGFSLFGWLNRLINKY